MNKAHSIQLIPTKAQKVLFHKSFGIARHSFNWALNVWQKQYKRGKKPSAMSLIKLQNSIKKKAFPFYAEVSKNAPQYAIWNVISLQKDVERKIWLRKSSLWRWFRTFGSKNFCEAGIII